MNEDHRWQRLTRPFGRLVHIHLEFRATNMLPDNVFPRFDLFHAGHGINDPLRQERSEKFGIGSFSSGCCAHTMVASSSHRQSGNLKQFDITIILQSATHSVTR